MPITNESSEARLRRAFFLAPAPGIIKESEKGSESSVGEGGALIKMDAARITAAVDQLETLASRATTDGPSAELIPSDSDKSSARDVELARELATKLVDGQRIPSDARTALVAELMIFSDGTRPSTLVRNGRIYRAETLGPFGDLYLGFLHHVDGSIAATGRIECSRRHIGTGILVTGRMGPMIVTAAHVAALCHLESGEGPAGPALIDFNGEFGANVAKRFTLSTRLGAGSGLTPDQDWATIGIGRAIDDNDLPVPAELDFDHHSLEPPCQTAIVSYPGRPRNLDTLHRQSPAWHSLFKGIWHVKRVSPARALSPDPRYPASVLHDGTTTAGSSGGAILSIGSGRVAAIHTGAPGVHGNIGLRISHFWASGIL